MKPIPNGTADAHLSRLAVARLLAGEADVAEKAGYDAHLADCPVCAMAYREAARAADGFSAGYPTLEYLAATRKARRNPSPAADSPLARLFGWFGNGRGWRPALGAALVLVVAVVYNRFAFRAPEPIAYKGQAAFRLFVNGKAATADSLECRPGDTLQLGLVAERPMHYAVLYRDDGGAPRAYLSSADAGNRPVGSPEGENLPHSLILDSAWATEILYCFASSRPIPPDTAATYAVREPPTGGDLRLKTFRLRNRAR